MRIEQRYLLQGGSVLLFAGVNAVSIAAVDAGEAGALLVLGGLCAVAAAVHAVIWGPEALTSALLLSLPPLFVLAADGTGSWLIGPLAALLLLAGELNAVGWEFPGGGASSLLMRRRVSGAALLAGGGAAASVAVLAAAGLGPSLSGLAALIAAAGALAALGWVIFGRGAVEGNR
jgi:hypothetical protein